MFVKRLVIDNFRCYKHLDISFTSNCNYITGVNGIGKTSIIEAINFLTLGRSFRKADNSQLIKLGENNASIYIEFFNEAENKNHTISTIISKDSKIFAYDGEKMSSMKEILRKLVTIYFIPSLVFFFQDEPENRRKYMDETLSQFSPQYFYSISQYKKFLKERNAALQQNYDSDIIDLLKDKLNNHAYRIVHDRKQLVNELNPLINNYYSALFNEASTLNLQYKTNCPKDDDQDSYIKEALNLFDKSKSNEYLKKTTLIGPHRDDLIAFLNKKPLGGFGSQGENRLASLSLRLATLNLYKKKLNVTPILLLDDITSDLDDQRCKNLLSLISKENLQVFITGTYVRNGFENYQTFKTDGNTLVRRNDHE